MPKSETRAFLLTLTALIFGVAGLAVAGPWPLHLIGGVLLVHGMRSFSSAVGHHMTHGAKVLPIALENRRLVYDIISAVLWLPSFFAYASGHREHHRHTAGSRDEDQRFIAYLGARFDHPLRLLLTLLNPLLHARFLGARIQSTFLSGPSWRRLVAIASTGLAIALLGSAVFAPWLIFAVLAYQFVTVLQWSTEHLWGQRSDHGRVTPVEAGVTYGRLLLPPTTALLNQPGARQTLATIARLLLYAVVKFMLLPGDLMNHDLHHLGRGPWLLAASVRAQLLRERDIPLYQTASLRGMFRLAYRSATSVGAAPLRDIPPDRLLQM